MVAVWWLRVSPIEDRTALLCTVADAAETHVDCTEEQAEAKCQPRGAWHGSAWASKGCEVRADDSCKRDASLPTFNIFGTILLDSTRDGRVSVAGRSLGQPCGGCGERAGGLHHCCRHERWVRLRFGLCEQHRGPVNCLFCRCCVLR